MSSINVDFRWLHRERGLAFRQQVAEWDVCHLRPVAFARVQSGSNAAGPRCNAYTDLQDSHARSGRQVVLIVRLFCLRVGWHKRGGTRGDLSSRGPQEEVLYLPGCCRVPFAVFKCLRRGVGVHLRTYFPQLEFANCNYTVCGLSCVITACQSNCVIRTPTLHVRLYTSSIDVPKALAGFHALLVEVRNPIPMAFIRTPGSEPCRATGGCGFHALPAKLRNLRLAQSPA